MYISHFTLKPRNGALIVLSSYTIKWIKIRHFISFYNSRSLLLVTMLAHRNQIANLIRSSSVLGNEVVDGCLFEQKYLATLSADTTGLCMDYAFYVSLFLLLSPHMFSPCVIYDIIIHFTARYQNELISCRKLSSLIRHFCQRLCIPKQS